MRTRDFRRSGWFCLLVAALATTTGRAFVVEAEQIVPMERMLANAMRVLKNNPDWGDNHYAVARLHYLIFSKGLVMPHSDEVRPDSWSSRDQLAYWEGSVRLEATRRTRAEELAREDVGAMRRHIPSNKKRAFDAAVVRRLRQLEQSNWTPAKSLPPAEMAHHAAEAMRELEEAFKLQPQNTHYALFRACLAEQFLAWSKMIKLEKFPAGFTGTDLPTVRDLYLRAFELGFTEMTKTGEGSDYLVKSSTYEAGNNFLRLFDELVAKRQPGDEQQRLRSEVIVRLDRLRTWHADETIELVSPVLFSLTAEALLDRLLDPTARVEFDLRGYGPRSRWSWVRPEAGLLVWDPERTGANTSGRELFGNYTFQIARATGYDALAALDDDGDGFLRGAELTGIRVWFDRNGNGRSDPGEVVDLAECGVVGVAVRATSMEGIHPMNARGLLMADGRMLPTWDWMATPMRD